MSSLYNLSGVLIELETELRSTKVLVRTKALNKFQHILDNRTDDLNQLLNASQIHGKTNWLNLFESIHESCVQQTNRLEDCQGQKPLQATENKNSEYSNIIKKLVNVANKENACIPISVIIEKSFHCFGNRWMCRYFGISYLQTVQLNVLNCDRDRLEDVRASEWSKLLSYCFKMYEMDTMDKFVILQCFTPIIEKGVLYTQLCAELPQYLPILRTIAAGNPEFNALTELMKTTYAFSSNLALDYRLAVCDFLEDTLGIILKSFGTRMSDDAKIILFKLLNLAIVIHHPLGGGDVQSSGDAAVAIKTDFVAKPDLWYRHLRNIFHLLRTHIKQMSVQISRFQTNSVICEYLVTLGASLCSVIFWNPEILQEQSDEVDDTNESNRKRPRYYSQKLQGIMDLIDLKDGKFCWRWMAILTKLLTDHRDECMSIQDHQPLLQMLHDFQLTIQFPYQVKILTNICQILLDLEPKFVADRSQLISYQFCDDLWLKIIQTAFRTPTANNAMFLENIRLIQLLFLKKSSILPNTFILSVVKTFLNYSIPKLNEIATLLIIIFKYTNIDSLGDAESVELRTDTLKWLHQMDLKQALRLDSEVISVERIAELSVLCLFSKIDLSIINRYNILHAVPTNEYTNSMKELKQNLLYKSMNNLLVFTEIDNESHGSGGGNHYNNLPQPNALKSIINENMFEKLYEILNPDKDIPTTDNAVMDLKKTIPPLAVYLQMLNQLILYEALDRDRVEKTFLAKKIHFKLEQFELCIGRIFTDIQLSNSPTNILSEKDLFDLLNEIETVFNPKLHTEIRRSIILSHSFRATVSWLKQQIDNIPMCRNSNSIVLYKRNDSGDKMSLTHRIKFKLFKLLTYFMDTNDEKGVDNQRAAISIISEFEFNLKSTLDLFCVLGMIEAILEQKSTVNKADWVFNQIKSLCQIHHRNQQISERIFELIPALAKFINIYPQMTDDMIILLSTYLAKKKFGQQITCKLIETLKWIAREYSDQFGNEDFTLVFQILSKYLMTNNLKIQYKTINVLCHVFDSNWIYGGGGDSRLNSVDNVCEIIERSRVSLKEFHENLFEKLKISKLINAGGSDDTDNTEDVIADIDRSSRLISICVQLFSGLIYKNYILQKKNWFLLAEFCYKKSLNQDLIIRVVQLLSEKFQIPHADLIKENIFYLLSMWLVKDYQLVKFPWFLTTSKTQKDFFYDHLQSLTICMLRHRPALLKEFVPLMSGETMVSMIKPVLPNCLAYMLPMFAECKMSITYLAKTQQMLKIIEQTFPTISDLIKSLLLETLENLTKNLWDEKMFDHYFKTNVDYIAEDYMIDSVRFDQCLNYVMKTINPNVSHKIFNYLSIHEPYKMYSLLTALKFNFQHNTNFIEQKLVYLFQYFAIVDRMITDLFTIESFSVHVKTDTVKWIKSFFIQDIIYFVCNLSMDNKMVELRLKQASCEYFFEFSKRILPKCSGQYSQHLNYIVSAFLPLIINQSVSKQYRGVPMKLLTFLIVDMRPVLEVDIALLDKFPNDEIFTELRKTHFDVKYNGKDFSLIDEIQYFLKIDKRNIEGFSALRLHLATKKHELREIYQQHEQMIEENYENSQLHRLIIALLRAVQCGDMEKSDEAVKCLGELGPTSLSSIVLKPDSQLNTYNYYNKFEHATQNLCQVIIQKLNSLLLHSDTRVLQVTSSALVFLLNHKVCQELAAEYPQLVIFKSQNPNKTLIYTPTNRIGKYLVKNLENIFIEEEYSMHSVWIKRFAIELLDIFGDMEIKQIVALQTEFTESILPLLAQMLLTCEKGLFHEALKNLVKHFFQKHFDLSTNSGDLLDKSKKQSIFMNHASIKSMLNIAECIRIHNIHDLTNQIKLNNLHIAKAAQFCNAYFTSILYGDLWALEENTTTKDNNAILDPILQNVMKEAYTAIGETDAIITFIDPVVSRHQYLEYKHSWNQIFLERDTLSYAEQNNIELSKQYLASSGLYGLSHSLRKTGGTQQYECAWRLCDWSQIDELTPTTVTTSAPVGTTSISPPQSHLPNENLLIFEKQHYTALRCLQMKDEIGVNTAINTARSAIIEALRNASLECTNNLYVHLMRLALIQQIDDFSHIQFHKGDQQFENIFDKWRDQDRIAHIDFNYKEPMLAQRITIFKSAGLRAIRKLRNTFNVRDDMLSVMILQLARSARIEGNSNLAIRYLSSLRESTNTISNEVKANLLLEDAQLNWHLGDQVLAKRLLDISLKNGDIESSLSRAVAIRIFGEYHAESQSKNVKFIIEKFFQASLKLIDNIELSKVGLADRMKMTCESLVEFCVFNRIEAYQMIGRYADSEYFKIQSYIKSPEFERKKERIARSVVTAIDMDNAKEMSKELRTARVILSRNVDIDRKEVKATELERCEYLLLALSNYVKVCQLRDDDDLTTMNKSSIGGDSDDGLQQRDAIAGNSAMTMFRIISLWFSNKHLENINEHLVDAFKLVASHKFMTVLPQVVVRISNDGCQFSQIVCDIVERCAIDHPQHTIYQILALSNAYADDSSQLGNSPEPRTLGAKHLIEKLSKNKKISIIISQMKEMCDALILFANKQIEANTIRISSKEAISKIRNLNMVHCPTLNICISKSGKYSDQMITVVKWSEKMSMVGGINAPKKLSCICSNGREYPQLLKGKDDMRQDAIMQQVFTILNKMLKANKVAKQRKLNVKTYKVVPLSNRSGILEWCSNSIPLNVYLVGQSSKKPGAHERYHPNDFKPADCRKAISKYNLERQSIEKKMDIFEKICSKFRPAFQYFFFEKFHKPGEWFERRLAYTNSVATTSMIGYILGIGDRHVSNILIDEKTAELIHIDFGIAFEQAKCLPTPETIPFRLTRDMVAAFGVSGVDGIFRKSCEQTMEVLRQNKTTIMTILEVLLFDPLYAWALTNKKAYSHQDIDIADEEIGEQKNTMAERALARLEAKLNGEEEGMPRGGTTTIEAQVELLISQARSFRNLCALFEGWQAYL